jgi:hypothetical protein
MNVISDPDSHALLLWTQVKILYEY